MGESFIDVLANSEVAQDEKQVRVLTIAELLRKPPPKWLLHGVLPETGLAVMFGSPGAGKTFAALDLGLSIARGKSWFGKRTKPGRVIYVASEGNLSNRLRAYLKHHRLHEGPKEFLVVEESIDLLHAETGEFEALVASIKAAVQDAVDLVIIDTLNRTMPGGDENSSKDMGAMVARAKQLEATFLCAVMYVHHKGKDEKAGARGLESQGGLRHRD